MALQQIVFANGTVAFYDDAVGTQDDVDRWQACTRLWVDGDEVARVEADDGEAQE